MMDRTDNRISLNGSFTFAQVRFFAGYYFGASLAEKSVRA